MRLLAATAFALLLVACPRKEDPTPEIPVTPGAAKVLDLLPSKSGKPRAPNAARARVHRMKEGEALGGPNATGKPGDFVLENDEVVFVIDALGESAGFSESGGNVIDAADARARKDELGQLFTYFGTFPRQAVYTSLDAKEEADGTAWVEAKGRELWDPSLAVRTRTTLAPGDRAILLETTVTNTGSTKVTIPGVGDVVHWGGAEKIAPGKPRAFRGPSKGPYVGGVGRFVSYAITSTDGEIAGTSGGAWTNTQQRKDVEVAPGASFTYKRVFVVGPRPDSSSIVAELTRASGGDVGTIAIALTDAGGKSIPVPRGARAVLGTTPTDDVLSVVATQEGETFEAEVPPGTWWVGFSPSAGRLAATPARVSVVVKEGGRERATLAVGEAHSVTFGPCEADGTRVPCKLTIEPLAGATVPDLGPAHVAGPARNQMTLGPGETITLPFPAGRYRVHASRGPEYDVTKIDVTVPGPSPGTMVLRRVLDTKGYVAADFHQHTILSVDAATSERDRVLANAAEGVEVAVASEHNVVTGFSRIAKELGVERFFVSVPGLELTTDASRSPWGHANVYPLTPDEKKPRGGAPIVRDRKPADVFAELRGRTGGSARVFQINHPRAPRIGYFDLLGFDPNTGRGTSPDYDDTFDAVEVWSARHIEGRAKVLPDYLALLRTSHPVTPIASTDTHGIVGQEPGMPRTFVRVTKDDALDAWDDARTADLVRGVKEVRDVVLTNGPFLSVSANGARIGGVARGPAVDVAVRVTSAPWVEVERVEIRTARGETKEAPVTQKRVASGALVAEARFALKLDADDAFVVIASGKKPMRPVFAGDDAEIAPWAMTGAIWVDADGDGKSLGRQGVAGR